MTKRSAGSLKDEAEDELTLKEFAKLDQATSSEVPVKVPRNDACHVESGKACLEALGKWSHNVVDALTWQRHSLLHDLALSIIKLSGKWGMVHPDILEDTGAGVLVADKCIWELAGADLGASMSQLAARWKEVVPLASTSRLGPTREAAKPLGGLRARTFLQNLQVLLDWATVVDPFTSTFTRRMVSKHLAMRNLNSIEALACVKLAEVDLFFISPAERALASKMIHRALVVTSSSRSNELEVETINPAAKGSRAQRQSAVALVDRLTPDEMLRQGGALEDGARDMNLVGLGTTLKPSEAVRALAVAKTRGCNVSGLLADQVDRLKAHSTLASLPSVRSGVRNWHLFATLVLGYEEGCTLPPRESKDVIAWAASFRNCGTASNYVGYVKWCCIYTGLAYEHWYTEELRLVLKGQQKLHLSLVGSQLKVKFLLTDEIVMDVILYMLVADSRTIIRLFIF